jgi:hypothetical protein
MVSVKNDTNLTVVEDGADVVSDAEIIERATEWLKKKSMDIDPMEFASRSDVRTAITMRILKERVVARTAEEDAAAAELVAEFAVDQSLTAKGRSESKVLEDSPTVQINPTKVLVQQKKDSLKVFRDAGVLEKESVSIEPKWVKIPLDDARAQAEEKFSVSVPGFVCRNPVKLMAFILVMIYYLKPLRQIRCSEVGEEFAAYVKDAVHGLQAYIDAAKFIMRQAHALSETESQQVDGHSMFGDVENTLKGDTRYRGDFYALLYVPHSEEKWAEHREEIEAEVQRARDEACEGQNILQEKAEKKHVFEKAIIDLLCEVFSKDKAHILSKCIARKERDSSDAKEAIVRYAMRKMREAEQLVAKGTNGGRVQELAELSGNLAKAAGIEPAELDRRRKTEKEGSAQKRIDQAAADAKRQLDLLKKVPIDNRSPARAAKDSARSQVTKNKKSKKGRKISGQNKGRGRK